MRVPLLDLSQQYAALAEPIRAQIEEVLATQHFILGPKVETFEAAIARYCGAPHAIGVSSGTDALERYLTESCRRESDGSLRTPKGEKVRALVPVHLFGLCCDMSSILEIAQRFQLQVIEDAAQALGAEYPFRDAT